MDKEKLASLAVKKTDRMERILSIKMDERLYMKLRAHDVDIAKTARAWFEAYAEKLK